MALIRSIYRALEDIVGFENISEEPAILDSYAFQWVMEFRPVAKGERFGYRPDAVILPGSTNEVQTIVKTCSRYKIKFKALSTGWGAWGGPGSEGVIQLDLRRMNRILEINERNMYAVVEPYVITARLQAELMKRGLNCNMIAAGSNVSALPLTASVGDGYGSISTSTQSRNVLGVEWISPTGELVRLGSLGSGAGWFCGDGPGPSLRGVIRGLYSVTGGLGVFTKAALKVYPWQGPQVPPQNITGISPSYTIKPMPQIHSYYIVFPSWEKMADAGIAIAESEIASMLASIASEQLISTIATSNDDHDKLYSDLLQSSKGSPCILIILRAISQREFNYQEKVLKRILAETGGKCLTFMEKENIQSSITWGFTRRSIGVRLGFRCCGGTALFNSFFTNWYRIPSLRNGECNTIRNNYLKTGVILDDGGDGGLSVQIENGHWAFSGLGALYDPIDTDSRLASTQMGVEADLLGLEKYKCMPITGTKSIGGHNKLGPIASSYDQWLRKIKNTFDPNTVSDPSDYIQPS